jgi:hypothetical protein
MTEFIVAIPTLNHYDLLKDCFRSILASSDLPREICVLDNGGRFAADPGLDEAIRCPIRVERPGRNLGVAGSWNQLHRLYAPLEVVYMNDDLMVAPDVLGRLVSSPHLLASPSPDPASWWSCFLQREAAWDAVGEYDDGFWPAGFADDDYRYRMRLAGLEPGTVDGHGGLVHRGGAIEGVAFTRSEWNRRRYIRKWGGDPGAETFSRPWDGQTHSELEMHYESVCENDSDIRDHCPTLALLASSCDHVTELGSRTGVSTTALLYAQPRDLVCYDLEPRPEFDNLYRFTGRTRLALNTADSREVTIAETDLLFIDTCHVYEQTACELSRHAAKVRKYIALHDTTTFGEHGELPGSRGIWPAIAEFLARRPEWELLARFHNNNGLTVLVRSGAGEDLFSPIGGPP